MLSLCRYVSRFIAKVARMHAVWQNWSVARDGGNGNTTRDKRSTLEAVTAAL